MDGIGKRMPLTMTAFAVAAAGMAGIPLIAGFVSKWFLLIGSVQADQAIFAVILLISGVLNIAYFWPIVYGAFFESHDDADSKPLVEGPLGGLFGPEVKIAPDGGTEETDSTEEEAHDSHDDHHGGPGPDGWERAGWTGGEGSWLMLGPILIIAAGAIVLGLVPYEVGFLELIELIAEGVSA
jgi:NADH-quinone oxidoreductase subunit L/multicomponent Na+:H+ antiporter subunit D